MSGENTIKFAEVFLLGKNVKRGKRKYEIIRSMVLISSILLYFAFYKYFLLFFI